MDTFNIFLEEIEKYFSDLSPLSLKMIKKQTKYLIRQVGQNHPILLEIIGLISGYSGKKNVAENFFNLSLKNLTNYSEIKEEIFYNLALYYLNIKDLEKAEDFIVRFSEVTEDFKKLELLLLEYNLLTNNYFEVTGFINDHLFQYEKFLKMMVVAGVNFKIGNKEECAKILHVILSQIMLFRARKYKDSFYTAMEEALNFLERLAEKSEPWAPRCLRYYKNTLFNKKDNILQFPGEKEK